jgi:hypothetical protein
MFTKAASHLGAVIVQERLVKIILRMAILALNDHGCPPLLVFAPGENFPPGIPGLD